MIRTTATTLGTLLLVIGPSGCAVHSLRTATLPAAVDRGCPTCDLTVTQGCRCSSDSEYHATAWFPLAPEFLGDIDAAEEATIPSRDAIQEIDPPRSVPFDADPPKDPEAGGREAPQGQATESHITHESARVISVIPEPSWQDSPSPTNTPLEEADTPIAPETGG